MSEHLTSHLSSEKVRVLNPLNAYPGLARASAKIEAVMLALWNQQELVERVHLGVDAIDYPDGCVVWICGERLSFFSC
jgi:hypothetical protein